MENLLRRLKEHLNITDDKQSMVTVKRSDLQKLVQTYEKMEEERSGLINLIQRYEKLKE
ncbi:hypothetical protein ACFW0L_24410 [Priestia megaterium]|uniref:hypothetical protein n=1 Tax=Priestia megaterium TaxID=1404 RepID=UPI0015CEF6A7|nr:hypothetical protein [Priestia megaterium]